MLRMYSCCIMDMTSGLRFTFNCTACMGSVSIFTGLSGIIFHFFLALEAVCVVVLWRDLHLALLLRTLGQFREVREVGRVSVSSLQWRPPLRRARTLEQAPPLEPPWAPWVVFRVVSIAVGALQVIVRALYVFPAVFFAHVFGVVCRGMFSAGAVYTPWLAAAAACQARKFVAVKAFVNPFRFDVVPGVAVVAPEEDTISFIVFCVRFVAEGDPEASLVDVFQRISCG